MLVHKLPRFILNNVNVGWILEAYEIRRGGILGGDSAITRSFKQGERESLEDNTNIEVNEAGAGNINGDSFDGEPKEEILSSYSGKIGNLAVAEDTGEVPIVTDLALELGIARLLHVDLESAGGLVDCEVSDSFWEEADWEAVGA